MFKSYKMRMMMFVHVINPFGVRKFLNAGGKQKSPYPKLDKGRLNRGSTLCSQIAHTICLKTLLET